MKFIYRVNRNGQKFYYNGYYSGTFHWYVNQIQLIFPADVTDAMLDIREKEGRKNESLFVGTFVEFTNDTVEFVGE